MFEHVPRAAHSPAAADAGHGEKPSALSLAGPLIYADRRILRYGSAVAIVLAVAGLRFALHPIMGAHAIMLPFTLAVLGAAILGGLGPALLASVLAPVVVSPLFAGSDDNLDPAWASSAALFLLVAAAVSTVMHRLQRSATAQRAALVGMWQSQKEASRSQAQLRLMADALPLLLSYIDAKERYRFSNSGYEDWFGAQPLALHGRHMQDVWGNAAYAALRPHIQAALSGNPVDCEQQLPHHSGVRELRLYLMPDVGPDNVVKGLFTLIEDITERKRARQALLDELSSHSAALDAAGASTFDWDLETDTLVWSGKNPVHGSLPGGIPRDRETWLSSVHADDRSRFLGALERALEDGQFVVDYRVCGKHGGGIRWLGARGQVLFRDGKVGGRLVGLNVPLTEPREVL
jgi:PAS domain S-box-containing protein